MHETAKPGIRRGERRFRGAYGSQPGERRPGHDHHRDGYPQEAISAGLTVPQMRSRGNCSGFDQCWYRPDELARCVGAGDSSLHDAKSLLDLVVGDLERDEHTDAIAIDARTGNKDAAEQAFLDDLPVESRCGLAGRTVLDELDGLHGAYATDITNDLVLFLPGIPVAANELSKCNSAVEQVLVFDNVDDFAGRAACNRVADIGATDAAARELVHDVFSGDDCCERHA